MNHTKHKSKKDKPYPYHEDEFPKIKLVKTKDDYKRKPKYSKRDWGQF